MKRGRPRGRGDLRGHARPPARERTEAWLRELGANLRDARIAVGVAADELGARLNPPRSARTVYRIEASGVVSAGVLREYAVAVARELDELLPE